MKVFSHLYVVHRRTGIFGLRTRKIYAMPEYVSVEIGMQTHSNCMKNKLVRQSQIVQSVMQGCHYVLSHLLPVCSL